MIHYTIPQVSALPRDVRHSGEISALIPDRSTPSLSRTSNHGRSRVALPKILKLDAPAWSPSRYSTEVPVETE
jgi:hypothetical protein